MKSSAARRGVAQRVLILSLPRRFSRVLGGTRHSALRLRRVSPSTAFAPNPRPPGRPGPAPAALGQWDQPVLPGRGGRGPEGAGGTPAGRRRVKSAAHLRRAARLGWRAEHRADQGARGKSWAPPLLQ